MEKLHYQPDADSPSLNLLQKTACLKIRKNCKNTSLQIQTTILKITTNSFYLVLINFTTLKDNQVSLWELPKYKN